MYDTRLRVLGNLLDFDVLVNLVGCAKMPKTANKFRALLMCPSLRTTSSSLLGW